MIAILFLTVAFVAYFVGCRMIINKHREKYDK